MGAVGEIWEDELTEMCSKLVESMPKRVQMCLKARGGHIKY